MPSEPNTVGAGPGSVAHAQDWLKGMFTQAGLAERLHQVCPWVEELLALYAADLVRERS